MPAKGVAPPNLPLLIEGGKATRFKPGQASHNKGVPASKEQIAKMIATKRARSLLAPDFPPSPPPNPGQTLSPASLNVRKLRASAIEILGGVCVTCGFADPRALQIDHVNGGGSKERRNGFKGSPRKLYKAVIADGGERYQLLCANCNCIKRIINQE